MLAGMAAMLAFLTRGRAMPPPPPPLLGTDGPTAGESYGWRPVAIGGGGFITGLSFSRAGDRLVARADVHGAYGWNAQRDRWESLVTAATMPESDRTPNSANEGVYEIVIAPSDPDRLYMALKGRIFRSGDGGKYWHRGEEHVFHFDPNADGRIAGPFLAVSPVDADMLLLGTAADGLWLSVDGARRWRKVETVPAARDAVSPGIAIWFAPDGKGQRIYAASPGNGLYLSEDGGRSFRPASGDPAAGPRAVWRGAFLADGGFLAVDRDGEAVWLYRGGGWISLTKTGALPPARYVGVAVEAGTDRAVVVDEGGNGWCRAAPASPWRRMARRVLPGKGEPPWLRVADQSYFATGNVVFDPARRGRLWAASGTGPYVADLGEQCDLLSWSSRVRGIEELVAMDVIQTPGHAPLFAALDFGIHVKPDLDRYSESYGPVERVLIAAQQLAWTPADPAFVATNASDTRTGCCWQDGRSVMAGYSTDGGASWNRFASLPTPPGTSGDDPWRMAFGTLAVAADSIDTIVWMPGYNRSPFYTRDRGRTWHRVALPGEKLPNTGSFPSLWQQRKTLAADRVWPGTFYLVHSGEAGNAALRGLWRTRNGGESWTRIFAGEIAPGSGHAAKLRAVPGHAGHLFFTSGVRGGGADRRLRRSVDGGTHWEAMDGITDVDDIAFGRAAQGARYPALYLSGRVNGRYGIWRSVDEGRRWQRLIDFPLGRLDQVTVMEADKDVFGRLFIGYMGSGWIVGEPARCTGKAPIGGDWQCATVGGAER